MAQEACRRTHIGGPCGRHLRVRTSATGVIPHPRRGTSPSRSWQPMLHRTPTSAQPAGAACPSLTIGRSWMVRVPPHPRGQAAVRISLVMHPGYAAPPAPTSARFQPSGDDVSWDQADAVPRPGRSPPRCRILWAPSREQGPAQRSRTPGNAPREPAPHTSRGRHCSCPCHRIYPAKHE